MRSAAGAFSVSSVAGAVVAVRDAAALLGSPRNRPGRLVEELRRVGVKDPVVVFDEIDRLGDGRGAHAALLELFAPEGRRGGSRGFRSPSTRSRRPWPT